jgi:hypothetical protein
MRSTLSFCFVVLLTINSVNAQETDPVKAWTDYMTPGKVHDLLRLYVGEWKQEITIWMQPGKPPEKFSAKASNRLLHGGRFLESKQTGEVGGRPYEGTSILAFNNATKKFTLAAFTNLGTGLTTLEGGWKEQGKSTELAGVMTSPADNKKIRIRQVIRFIDKDNMLIENYDQWPGEEERKTTEYKLVRLK